MSYQLDLALTKQAYDQLVALCPPEDIRAWQPSGEQRTAYVTLAKRVLDGVERLQTFDQRKLFTDARLHSVVPESLLTLVRTDIKPQADRIKAALNYLDPDDKELRDLLDLFTSAERPHGVDGKIRKTFEVGLERVDQLLEDNPGQFDDEDGRPAFLPVLAFDVFDSKLLQFDPDAWLDRIGELRPFRTHRINLTLPVHVRYRLEELYRAYVFGLWLSVFGLARAILEYAIVDNLSKFRVDATWPEDRDGRRREKKLSPLVEEVSEHLPQCKNAMTFLRECGNEYLHPKKKNTESSLFQRRDSAKRVVSSLVEVVEALYNAPRET